MVAIAQSYRSFLHFNTAVTSNGKQTTAGTTGGWENKMYVRADLMPHRIEITDARFERLQDISDEDCLKEGIKQATFKYMYGFGDYEDNWATPREAFAALIDLISGKGTWERNPWVIAYTFRRDFSEFNLKGQGTPTGGIKKGDLRWHEYID